MKDRAFEIVREQLLALELPDVQSEHVVPDSSLVDDRGLDSLEFVDLTAGLEEALVIEGSPKQEWVQRRMDAGQPLTVAAMIVVCQSFVQRGPDASPVPADNG